VPTIVLAHDAFEDGEAKTAEALVEYADVAAVVDRSAAITTAESVVGPAGRNVPVVSTTADALGYEADAFAIGVAPVGGRLPDAWRTDVQQALEHGLTVLSGLHDFLGEDPEFTQTADAHGAEIHDLRAPPEEKPIYTAEILDRDATIVLTVGTDCSSGKMTTSLELVHALEDRGVDTAFAATGQTGLMLDPDAGVIVDAVPADFVAGWTEKVALDALDRTGADVVVVEGQGALSHPAYAGVSTGLLHGASPHACVLCHDADRKHKTAKFHEGRRFPVLDPTDEWRRLETMAEPIRTPTLAGVSVMNGPIADPQGPIDEVPRVDALAEGADRLAERLEAIR